MELISREVKRSNGKREEGQGRSGEIKEGLKDKERKSWKEPERLKGRAGDGRGEEEER